MLWFARPSWRVRIARQTSRAARRRGLARALLLSSRESKQVARPNKSLIMRTIILSPAAYNLAETTRMIAIGRALQDDFDLIFAHNGGEFSHLIENAGFRSRQLEPEITAEKAAYLYKVDQGQALGYFFSPSEVERQVKNEIALYEEVEPVAAVTGFNFSLSLSCRVARVPLVWVTQSTWMWDQYYDAGLGSYVDMVDLPLLRLLPERVLIGLSRTMISLVGALLLRPYNIVGKQYGIPPFRKLESIWEGDYNLLAEPEGFCDLPVSPKYHFIGPLIARLDEPVPKEVLDLPHDMPIIYLALGSSGQPDVLARIIEGFEGRPYRVITPAKALLERTKCRVPENVIVTGWLPSHLVNPLADICVLHGGIGTVMTACLAGKPVVGVAMQPEQEFNVDCLVRRGFAIRIRKNRLTADKLCEAIDSLLNDDEAKARASTFAEVTKKWDGAANSNIRSFFKEKLGEKSP